MFILVNVIMPCSYSVFSMAGVRIKKDNGDLVTVYAPDRSALLNMCCYVCSLLHSPPRYTTQQKAKQTAQEVGFDDEE